MEKSFIHNQKYRPTNQLQKDCWRQFRKCFPDLIDRIRYRESILHPENFCFSFSADNSEFGEIIFDIDEQEIAVFTDFDHHHYGIYFHEDNREDVRRQRTVRLALASIEDIVSGDIIVELEKKGDKIIKAFRYHKDNPDNKMSAFIDLDDDTEKLDFDQTVPIERVLVNWKGIIKKEELLAPTSATNRRVDSDKSNGNPLNKVWGWLTGN